MRIKLHEEIFQPITRPFFKSKSNTITLFVIPFIFVMCKSKISARHIIHVVPFFKLSPLHICEGADLKQGKSEVSLYH